MWNEPELIYCFYGKNKTDKVIYDTKMNISEINRSFTDY